MSITRAVDPTNEVRQDFDRLFAAHYDAIYRYCIRRLGPSDAEDGAADVFATAWTRLHEMPDGELRRAWLFGVAYRVVGNRYRSRRRQARLSRRIEAESLARHPGHQSGLWSADNTELLLRALDDLTSADRELLRLWSWDHLSRTEIAHVLGIKENAVDQRLHRARSRLRARFERLSATQRPPGLEEASS
ncbi:MAG: RNA polymerase sigma factor [Acidimicrobiia bacterium]